MKSGIHYNAANYYTKGWTYPRTRLRQPFPRKVRQADVFLFKPPVIGAVGPMGQALSGLAVSAGAVTALAIQPGALSGLATLPSAISGEVF